MNEPSLEFACPVCGDAMMIPDSLRGRELQCPHEGCGALFQTPPLDEPPEPENEAPPATVPAGAKKRQPQMPRGPGLKRKGPGPATTPKPPPTRTEKPPPAAAAAETPPAAPVTPPARHQMGTGTKISYVVGILAVIGMVIYNKVKKAEAAARPPAPAAHSQPAAPRPPAAKPAVAPTEITVPPPKAPPASMGRKKEMTEEDRNRLNESFAKLDDEKRKEQKEHFEKRLAKAKTGSKTAQLDVGTMYLKGAGVEPDRKLAREWLDKSAAQNHAEAFLALGELEAMEGDTGKAVKQYAHAGDMVVADFQKGEGKAKEVVEKALEQLSVLGAHEERNKLAGETTERNKPEPESAPDANRAKETAPAAETPAPPVPAAPAPAPPAPEEPDLVPPDPPAAPALTAPPLPVPPPPAEPPVAPGP